MFRKAIVPILAIAAALVFAPRPARAETHFGIYVGGPPVVVTPPPTYADPYYNPYYDPYYAAPPVYPYPYGYGYAVPAPSYRYNSPRYYAPHHQDYRRHGYRGYERHEFHGRGRR